MVNYTALRKTATLIVMMGALILGLMEFVVDTKKNLTILWSDAFILEEAFVKTQLPFLVKFGRIILSSLGMCFIVHGIYLHVRDLNTLYVELMEFKEFKKFWVIAAGLLSTASILACGYDIWVNLVTLGKDICGIEEIFATKLSTYFKIGRLAAAIVSVLYLGYSVFKFGQQLAQLFEDAFVQGQNRANEGQQGRANEGEQEIQLQPIRFL